MVRHGGPAEAFEDAAASGPLEAALRRLALTMLDDATVDGVLELIVELAVSGVHAADAASAGIARGAGPCVHMASTSVAAADAVQDRHSGGPRPHVIERGRRYNGALAAERNRWPQFCDAALDAGFHSVLALPLQTKGRTTGALLLYSQDPAGFGQADVAASEVLARQAQVTVANVVSLTAARLTAQYLQDGFVSRELIGMAQGILMARHGCRSERAFDMLRHSSQSRNLKVRDIAAEVVAEYD